MTHGAVRTQDERGDEKPQRVSTAQEETDGEETEERAPPKRSPAPNGSSRREGEGGGWTPTQQRAPTARSEGLGGDPPSLQHRTLRTRGTGNQRGDPSELSERWSPTEDGPRRVVIIN